jgi:hypothetical protein
MKAQCSQSRPVLSLTLSFILPFALILLNGCAATSPWEREYLADPSMLLEAETPLVFEAREGSAGAVGGQGGGCACKR